MRFGLALDNDTLCMRRGMRVCVWRGEGLRGALLCAVSLEPFWCLVREEEEEVRGVSDFVVFWVCVVGCVGASANRRPGTPQIALLTKYALAYPLPSISIVLAT